MNRDAEPGEKHPCEGRVYIGSGYGISSRPCTKNGVSFFRGSWYCSTHLKRAQRRENSMMGRDGR